MEAIPEELEPANEPAWKNVELVQDAIIKHLTVKELKLFRMTCRAWAFAGARQLVHKTLIRLTGIVSLKPVAEKVPVLTGHCSRDADFYEDDRVLETKPEEYFHMDSYVQYLESASVSFDSGFTPKCVSVVCASDVWQLPMPHFSSLEDLQVLTFRPSEGLKLLNEFHLFFPKLKSLELRYIQPDAGAVSVSMDSSAAPDAAQEGSEAESSQIVLEKLSLTASSCWPYMGPEVVQRFKKLKVLTLIWSGDYPRNFSIEAVAVGDFNRLNFDSMQYVDWLQGSEFPAKFSLLTEMSLRFDLLPSISSCARNVLKAMKLKKLSLELYGTVQEFSEFVLGLSRDTIASLEKIHLGAMWLGGHIKNPISFEQSLVWLGDNGFFEKPEWTLTFFGLEAWSGWCLFVKTQDEFRYQISISVRNLVWGGLPELIFEYLKQTSSYNLYNYSFRSFCLQEKVIKFESEKVLPQDLFSLEDFPDCEALPHIRFSTMMSGGRTSYPSRCLYPPYRCRCPYLCKKPSALLCEIPPFLKEAGIESFPGHLVDDSALATLIVCHVQPEILEKWTAIRDHQGVQREAGYRCRKTWKKNRKAENFFNNN